MSAVTAMQQELVSQKQMRQTEAGRILNLSTRQIKRLLKAYREQGAAGLVSKHRTNRSTCALRNAQVAVCVKVREELTILYNGKTLSYSMYHQQAKQAEIVSTKQLGHTLHQRRLPHKPAADHP